MRKGIQIEYSLTSLFSFVKLSNISEQKEELNIQPRYSLPVTIRTENLIQDDEFKIIRNRNLYVTLIKKTIS